MNFLDMSRNRVTIEKAGKVFELTKTPEGENSCKLCAFCQLCLNIDDGISDYPCDEFGKGVYYFKIS